MGFMSASVFPRGLFFAHCSFGECVLREREQALVRGGFFESASASGDGASRASYWLGREGALDSLRVLGESAPALEQYRIPTLQPGERRVSEPVK